jgi:hypothetical protein
MREVRGVVGVLGGRLGGFERVNKGTGTDGKNKTGGISKRRLWGGAVSYKGYAKSLAENGPSAADLVAVVEAARDRPTVPLIAVPVIKITAAQLDDMRHALGWSSTPNVRKLGWRNYYWSDTRVEALEDLVTKGLMVVRELSGKVRGKEIANPAFIYHVSRQGAAVVGLSASRIKKCAAVLPSSEVNVVGFVEVQA